MRRREMLGWSLGAIVAPSVGRTEVVKSSTTDAVDTVVSVRKKKISGEEVRARLNQLGDEQIIGLTKGDNPRLFDFFHDNWEEIDQETRQHIGYILYRSLELRNVISSNSVGLETIRSLYAIFHPHELHKEFMILFNRSILIDGDRADRLSVKYSKKYRMKFELMRQLESLGVHYDEINDMIEFPALGVISILGDGIVPDGWQIGIKTNVIPTAQLKDFDVDITPGGAIVFKILFDGGTKLTQIFIRDIQKTLST